MNTVRSRSSALIYKAYRKLVIPEIAARLCNIIVRLVDSLIAARFIGMNAMTAITLVLPITLFGSCLFDILVSGTTPVLIKYKSRGQLARANRAFGAILANTFLWYVIGYSLLLIFSKHIFALFTDDSRLIADSVKYFTPIAIFEPFSVLGLCFERGFKSEGRNGFFGVRAIITNCANIVLSLVAVSVFDSGIVGISIASNLAGLIGYGWSFSYFFNKNCTTRPDFSVLSNRAEMKEYLHAEMEIGRVYALDDGLYAGASALFSKAIILTGGTAALTAVGICNAVCGVITSTNGAIRISGFSLINLFHADKDYKGVARALNAAMLFQALFSVLAWLVLNIFYQRIGIFYKVDDEAIMHFLRLCLCFNTIVVICDSFSNLFCSFMMATERTKAAARYAITFNVMIAVCALFGLSGVSFKAFLCVYMAGAIVVACLECRTVLSVKKGLLATGEAEIQTYSYTLKNSTCAEISAKIGDLLNGISLLSGIAAKAALLVEECNRMILYVNHNNKKNISVDFRISADEEECVITLIDTGILFDPVNRLKESELPEEYAFSRQILKGASPQATYTRIVNLNVSRLVIPLHSSEARKEI